MCFEGKIAAVLRGNSSIGPAAARGLGAPGISVSAVRKHPIKTQRPHRTLTGAAVLAVALLGAACTSEEEAPGSPEAGRTANGATPGQGMPAIYVDQQTEFLTGGRNIIREGYLRDVERCRQQGPAVGMPVQELAADDVEKLGMGRLQRWYKPGSFAVRWETWKFATDGSRREGLCTFALTRDGYHRQHTPQQTLLVVLKGDADGAVQTLPPYDADFFARPALDEDDGTTPAQAQARRIHRAPDRDRTVMGQPCWHQTDMQVDGCAWAGGRQWGFQALTAGMQPDNLRALNSRITLEQEPVGGTGLRLSTTRFEIGADFNDSDMVPGSVQ